MVAFAAKEQATTNMQALWTLTHDEASCYELIAYQQN